jgi:hypothetical protein
MQLEDEQVSCTENRILRGVGKWVSKYIEQRFCLQSVIEPISVLLAITPKVGYAIVTIPV